jgi:hypothetical protein
VLLIGAIMSVPHKKSLSKVLKYLQATSAAEAHLAEGLASVQWRISKIEK